MAQMIRVSPLPPDVLENAYAALWRSFRPAGLHAQIDNELGGTDVIDGLREVRLPEGRVAAIRASRDRGPTRGAPRQPFAVR